MDLPVIYYNPAEYIETASGNKVCCQSVICGSKNIMLNGKTIIHSDSIIRGDLAKVKIGRHCVISRRSVIRPPYKKYAKGLVFFGMQIGNHTFIGEDSIINSSSIGSCVHIGKNCVIGRHSILKDCCAIADNTIIPPGTIVPTFAVFAGSPGKIVDELPECTEDVMIDFTKNYYANFVSSKQKDIDAYLTSCQTHTKE